MRVSNFISLQLCIILGVSSLCCRSEKLHRQQSSRLLSGNNNKTKQGMSYICPPNFMRLSYKCYYFSNNTATWQEAYWKCRDMKSNIATIKNGNQDKVIRRTLNHRALVPTERWIGARYDWGTMSWKWAASGRVVQFQGFGADDIPTQKENLDWHCIILDPKKHNRWSSRSCTEQKHYICQTKIRMVDNADKSKIQRQYDAKINEVPVPDIITNSNTDDIQSNDIPRLNNIENHNNKNPAGIDNEFNNEIAFAYRRRKPKRNQQRKKDDDAYHRRILSKKEQKEEKDDNEERTRRQRTRRNKHKLRNNGNNGNNRDSSKAQMDRISWKTYYEATKSPLHPRVAVEEFSF